MWVLLLVVVNGVLPFWFLDYLTAKVTLTAFVTGSLVGVYLCGHVGFNKLLGLMHAPWVPMLAVNLLHYPGWMGDPYTLWLTTSIVVTALSLALDIMDLVVWARTSAR